MCIRNEYIKDIELVTASAMCSSTAVPGSKASFNYQMMLKNWAARYIDSLWRCSACMEGHRRGANEDQGQKLKGIKQRLIVVL